MAEHRLPDISNLIGRPVTNLRYWVDQQIIIPDIAPSQGKGKERIFSGRNLLEFGMLDIMTKDLSVPLEMSKVIFGHLRLGHGPDLRGEFQEDFPDFYTNDQWGLSKDLIFNVYTSYEAENRDIRRLWFFTIARYVERDLRMSIPETVKRTGWRTFDTFPANSLDSRALCLGYIKRLAKEKVFGF